MFPTADEIAIAVVTACRLTKEGPMATCMRQPSRARSIALQALMDVFPDAQRTSLARCVGHPKPPHATASVNMARKCSWWREDWLEEVVGAVVARQYGDQAA